MTGAAGHPGIVWRTVRFGGSPRTAGGTRHRSERRLAARRSSPGDRQPAMRRYGYIVLGAAAAAAVLALAACGKGAVAGSAMLADDRAGGDGGLQSGRRLAAAGDARRLAEDADQLPRTAPARPCRAVRVRGSCSGVHRGVLRAYSTGTGESFLPAHPFVAGERVSVSATRLRRGRLATAPARASRSPTRRPSTEAIPQQPRRPEGGAALQHSAPALTPSTVHDHDARRSPERAPATCCSRRTRAGARPGR